MESSDEGQEHAWWDEGIVEENQTSNTLPTPSFASPMLPLRRQSTDRAHTQVATTFTHQQSYNTLLAHRSGTYRPSYPRFRTITRNGNAEPLIARTTR
jgi:hypothetical protein